MKTALDRIVAAAIVGIGAVHIGVTPIVFPHLNEPALWFISGGLAMIFQGALNLLRNRYVDVAPGVRRTCIAVNLAVAAFVTTYIVVTGRNVLRAPQAVVLLGLVMAATLFSLARPPRLWSIRDEIKPTRRRAA